MSFPRFDEYLPGTILEITVNLVNNNNPFLIVILKDGGYDGVMFRNSREEVIAVWINEGGCIMKGYKWKITHQEVKKGGLINGS